jgi:hypothetical protein
MARHILGVANTGGGCIILGVTQKDDNSLSADGLSSLLDKADVYRGMQKFLPDTFDYHPL